MEVDAVGYEVACWFEVKKLLFWVSAEPLVLATETSPPPPPPPRKLLLLFMPWLLCNAAIACALVYGLSLVCCSVADGEFGQVQGRVGGVVHDFFDWGARELQGRWQRGTRPILMRV